jgi:hypothetical protein
MDDRELREHLTARHPGIALATGPTGMYPQGRPAEHLAVDHTIEHERWPEHQDHAHGSHGEVIDV